MRHYSDVSDAIDIGILVYVTNYVPGGSIEPDTLRTVAAWVTRGGPIDTEVHGAVQRR